MLWWLLVGLVAVVVCVALFLTKLLPRGRLYWATSGGFGGWSRHVEVPQATDRRGVEKAIAALFPRDRFDCLCISVDEEHERGLTIDSWQETLSISLAFTIARDPAEEAWVRAYFAERGVPCESNDYNIGMGPELEARSLDFHVGEDSDLITMTFEVLDGLFGQKDVYFVSASASEDGPGDGSGLMWRPHRDRLKGVL